MVVVRDAWRAVLVLQGGHLGTLRGRGQLAVAVDAPEALGRSPCATVRTAGRVR